LGLWVHVFAFTGVGYHTSAFEGKETLVVSVEDYEVTRIYSHQPYVESKLSASFSETVFEPHYREVVPLSLPILLVRRYMEQVLPSNKFEGHIRLEPLFTVFHFR
jgi:hypothetical protein